MSDTKDASINGATKALLRAIRDCERARRIAVALEQENAHLLAETAVLRQRIKEMIEVPF